jgi:hypothetical protein
VARQAIHLPGKDARLHGRQDARRYQAGFVVILTDVTGQGWRVCNGSLSGQNDTSGLC